MRIDVLLASVLLKRWTLPGVIFLYMARAAGEPSLDNALGELLTRLEKTTLWVYQTYADYRFFEVRSDTVVEAEGMK